MEGEGSSEVKAEIKMKLPVLKIKEAVTKGLITDEGGHPDVREVGTARK
jgi:hypothetical protein